MLWLALCCQPAAAQLTGIGGTSSSGCNPAVSSCVPATCTPLQQSIGTCTGSGGSGGGGGVVAPMCVPTGSGDPGCGGSSAPAAVGGGAGGEVQLGGGNPINLVTGDKYQVETDVEPLPGVLGLELRRHYNSLSAHAGLIGAGWHMSYETVLYDLGTQIEIVQADGQRLTFHRGTGSQAALCTAAQPRDGQVTIAVDARGETSYVWRWPDGRKLLFSGGSGGGHPLQAITASTGEQLTVTYSPAGDLVQVRDPQGRKLNFIYNARHVLQAIDTPLGRFDYSIDAQGRLTQVATRASAAAPPARVRIYHYEDRYDGGHPYALTGISLRTLDAASKLWTTQRLSTYAYGIDGLAILTTKGEPRQVKDGKTVPGTGIEQVDVSYVTKPLPTEGRADASGEVQPHQLGKTVITNSLGQKTELLSTVIGGHFRLVQMTGPGCNTCGPSNMHYTYNASGQVLRVITLDAAGKPKTAIVEGYDAFGRFVREGVQSDPAAKTPSTRWTRRYEYVDTHFADGSVALAAQPALMATPSVLAGREHIVRFAYNTLGQRLSVTEEGFTPGDALATGPTLVRTTRFTYATIHGHSVLTRIDGPLPNGPRGDPSDSDVTDLRYDEQGERVVAITSPGGLTVRAEATDAAGRLSRVVLQDSHRQLRRDFTYDSEGHESALEETAWLLDAAGAAVQQSRQHRVTRYERDSLGRLVALEKPDGTRLTTAFDLAGEPVRLTAPDGSFVELQRDTETRVVAAMRHGNESTLSQTLRIQRSAEHFDRIDGMEDDLGKIAEFGYPEHADEDARPTDVRHASGAKTLYRYDETDTIVTQILAAGTPDALERHFDVDVAGRTSRIEDRSPGKSAPLNAQLALYDDFGRKIVYASPEHGVTRYLWDSADHLIARVSQDRHVYRITYDSAGRTIATGIDDRVALTTYRYAGNALAETRDTYDGSANHSKEVERMQHDAFGRVTREEHWLADVRDTAPPAAEETRGRLTVTEFHYEEDTGRLAWKSVLDSQQREHRIDYHWDRATGRLTGFAFNGHDVVTDIQGTWIGGTTAIAWADGTREESVRDARGRLTDRIVHQPEAPPLLSQHWQYDEGDHLRRDDTDGAAQNYAYDLRNRVIAESGAVKDARFAYDPVNNRMGDAVAGAGRRFAYRADGLIAAEPRAADPGWLAVYDAHGATVAKQPFTATTMTHAAVMDTRSRPLQRTGFETTTPVQYTWGVEGERVAKTVANQRTWYHYEPTSEDNEHGMRLSAEAADDGAIVTHYVYADGRMIARIDTPETLTGVAGEWTTAKRVALGWLGQHAAASAHAYAVHVDQRGAVVAVSDGRNGLAWRARYDAYGEASVSVAKITMNARLAGQYYDSETDTNDNLQREYSPNVGRYLSADPISTNAALDLDTTNRLAGVNPYVYVSADPLDRTDTQGLYESDVHFYMTYFLAIIAGMSSTDARMMAEATQYVDDNPQTTPVNETDTWTEAVSSLSNKKQLLDYHFTLSGPDGKTLPLYANTMLSTTDSPQLAALHSYALPWPGSCGFPNNTSLQFMGEYLHAYEDTYAHRDNTNMPYDAIKHLPFGLGDVGLGHGADLHNPDLTYNHDTTYFGNWTTNESRTFTMESAVYGRITSYMTSMNYVNNAAHLGKQTDFNNPQVLAALKSFNAYPASQEGGDLWAKVYILNNALHSLGYPATLNEYFDPAKAGTVANGGYNVNEAANNRQVNLGALDPASYPAAMLPASYP